MQRPQATLADADRVIEDIADKLAQRLKQNGYGVMVSGHETLGHVTEEYLEYTQAITKNDEKNQEDELIDIAVACIWGIVSLREEKK